MMIFASFLLSAALAAGPPPEFNPMEPISLDLKDASITDVITMLGALANAPVSIAPDVNGSISIQVKDVPYAKVLELIGQQNHLAIRFEGGNLVATRSEVPLPVTGSSVPAPKGLPAGPRLSVEDYSAAAAAAKPLFVRARPSGAGSCMRVDFQKGGGFEVPLPDSAEAAVVTQFGWDPVTRTRFVAVEVPGASPKAFALVDSRSLSLEAGGEWTSSDPRGRACGDVASSAPTPRGGSHPGAVLRLDVSEEGGAPVITGHKLHTVGGQGFSLRGGSMGVGGQHDEAILFGYLSSDGKSIAVALMATSIRTDPRDGREYVYSQVSSADSVRFTTLAAEPALLAVLPAGPARERPLELRASYVSEP